MTGPSFGMFIRNSRINNLNMVAGNRGNPFPRPVLRRVQIRTNPAMGPSGVMTILENGAMSSLVVSQVMPQQPVTWSTLIDSNRSFVRSNGEGTTPAGFWLVTNQILTLSQNNRDFTLFNFNPVQGMEDTFTLSFNNMFLALGQFIETDNAYTIIATPDSTQALQFIFEDVV